MLTYANTCCDVIATPWQWMQSTKSMDFNGCSMARPFHSLWRVWLVRLTKEGSFMPTPSVLPSEKRSGEQSQISWDYYPKVIRTNEIVRSVIITSTSLEGRSSLCSLQLWRFSCLQVRLVTAEVKNSITVSNLQQMSILTELAAIS